MLVQVGADEDMFVVEGKLTELQIARTTQNLLEQIEKHSQAKSIVAGIGVAAGGMYGLVANAAALALYDGEDVHNFAAVLGKDVVCGTFRDADRLKDGDEIKAVASKRGDVLYAHCVVRKNDQQVFLPLMTYAGEKAHFRSCMRVALWGSIFVSLLLAGGFLLFWPEGDQASNRLLQASFVVCLLVPPLFAFPFELWSYRTVRGYGEYASAIFKKLGVPRPEDFDSRQGITHFDDRTIGTNFKLALERHKAKFGIKK